MSIFQSYMAGKEASRPHTPIDAYAPTDPYMSGTEASGKVEAERVVGGLVQRGLPLHLAVAAAAGMGSESGFDPGINEINPTVPGSRGGFGLNQWTGPRRRQYEEFAARTGRPLDSLEAQLDFTVWELMNTERAAYDAMMQTGNVADAARLYEGRFLRPGISHADKSVARAMELWERTKGGAYDFGEWRPPALTGNENLTRNMPFYGGVADIGPDTPILRYMRGGA